MIGQRPEPGPRHSDPQSVVYGWEPVVFGDDVVGYIAGGDFGYCVGTFLAHAFVDAERADVGTEVGVQATGIRHVAEIVKDPLFDPENTRIKA